MTFLQDRPTLHPGGCQRTPHPTPPTPGRLWCSGSERCVAPLPRGEGGKSVKTCPLNQKGILGSWVPKAISLRQKAIFHEKRPFFTKKGHFLYINLPPREVRAFGACPPPHGRSNLKKGHAVTHSFTRAAPDCEIISCVCWAEGGKNCVVTAEK